ncbi:unnamed protein product [Owenia fusiformis]|uniref:Chitinase n=1 Tax=Owenia fusiformis TaxID=6347 RepID=A0A8S4Q0A2_OWEFU|nr:unnamed protein product [Owenia fusiformis]
MAEQRDPEIPDGPEHDLSEEDMTIFLGDSNVPTSSSTTTTKPTLTSTKPSISSTIETGNFCHGKRDRLYRDPKSCESYISCWNGINQGITTCPDGTLFSEERGYCDWDYNVDCGTIARSTTTTKAVKISTMSPEASTSASTISASVSSSTSSSVLLVTSTTKATPEESLYKRVCYFTNWAQYRVYPGKFFPSDVDPFLCTHIIYSFGKVVNGPADESTIEPYEWNDISVLYPAIMALKSTNPNLKVLLAIGGWTHGSKPFTELVASPSKLRNFVWNSITYLRHHGFDGLDLDWEYPTARGGIPADRERFVELCRELRGGFELEATQSNRERMLLTAAVGCGKDTIDAAYDINGFTPYLDFINLMTYDLAGQWDGRTAIHSALHPRNEDPAPTLNQEYAVNRFINEGTPPEKLILGIPLYGRTFRLSTSATGLGAPTATFGAPSGPITNEEGFMSYYEICQKIASGWTYEYDNEHDDSYAFSDSDWVGYTDTLGIKAKIDFIKDMRLGGAMVWALDLDDFTGNLCSLSLERYPLLNAIKNGLTT